MQSEELILLAQSVHKNKYESKTLEVKSANLGCPTKLYPTLSSFSNQDNGGIILFGLDEKNGFEIVGVYNPQDLQKQVVEQCKQMEPTVHPLFTFAEIDGVMVVSAEIPSKDISERPVYYKGAGRIKGSYTRVGDSNDVMSEYEIYSYDAFRKRIQDDLRKVENAKISQFDSKRLEQYLNTVKENRKNLASSVSDNEILELMGITINDIPTLSGVMTFSKYPQGYFPQFSITAVAVPGIEMGETGKEGERFIDNKRITGAIPDMIEDAIDFIRINSRNKVIIDDNGKRQDKSEYPTKAVREAILNALIHRDYSIHTQSVPIRIEMYRDRLKIINPGGLYGKITIDSLGAVHPDTRNATLANILELLGVTENRYSGIPTIRYECRMFGIPSPVFEVSRGEFIVTFKNNIYESQQNRNWRTIQEDLLEFCITPKTRAEILNFTGYSRYYSMKTIVQPLIDNGELIMSDPERPKSAKQKYTSTRK